MELARWITRTAIFTGLFFLIIARHCDARGLSQTTNEAPNPLHQFGRLIPPKSNDNAPANYSIGLNSLGLNKGGRDGVVFIPNQYKPSGKFPLLVLLHGAKKNGADALNSDFAGISRLANEKGIILLVPDSRDEVSWDLLRGGFGPDVAFISAAVTRVLRSLSIKLEDTGIAGFSDGATYAVSLGLRNGDLFPKVIGFSGGGVVPGVPIGQPKFFITHGAQDNVLPIDERIVFILRSVGFSVTFKEFQGGHFIPDEIANEAIDWFLAS